MTHSGLTDAFRAWLLGLALAQGEYRLALYTLALGPETVSYTPAGEVSGQGYPAGGLPLSGGHVALAQGVAVLEWAAVVFDPATVDAMGALVYNASVPGKPSVAVIAFDQQVSSTNGPFTVPLAQLIQWGR